MSVQNRGTLRLLLRCQSVNEVLSEYVDGDMGFVSRTLLWGHLLMCKRCRGYLAQFRRIVELDGGPRLDTLPPGAEQALRSALEAWRDQR